jgi:hypothetical protein
MGLDTITRPVDPTDEVAVMRRFEVHEAPRSHSRFLQAQNGLFLRPTLGCAHFSEFGTWPDLESLALLAQRKVGRPVLRKITVPADQAGDVLRRLWLSGVSRAHLMPTYDNVTAALLSKAKWNLDGVIESLTRQVAGKV